MSRRCRTPVDRVRSNHFVNKPRVSESSSIIGCVSTVSQRCTHDADEVVRFKRSSRLIRELSAEKLGYFRCRKIRMLQMIVSSQDGPGPARRAGTSTDTVSRDGPVPARRGSTSTDTVSRDGPVPARRGSRPTSTDIVSLCITSKQTLTISSRTCPVDFLLNCQSLKAY